MTLRKHQRGGVDGGDVTAAKSDVERVDDVDRLLPEAGSAHHFVTDDRGVVHQNVEPALFGRDPIEQRPGLFVVGVVDGDGDSRTTGRPHQLGGFVDRACERRLAGLLVRPVT